ncbi:MAG TPA: hypothetical protein VJ715_08975 [Pyrinomonadaceae bacterium]|nr:hypothetical protein [Pyrinomonadaceae bacterium]
MSSRAETTSRGRLLKLTIILAVLGPLFICGRAAHAQDKQPPSARKFDEFGDIQMSDLKARLDNFAIALQGEPATRGFIIVYRSRRDLPGLSSRLALRAKDYMVNSRGAPKERVVTVDGGPAECLTHELWVVDPGAAPKPRADAYSRTFIPTESALKFDELYYPVLSDPQGDDEAETGISSDVLEAFASALRSHPRTQAYIIAYKQHQADRRSDAPGVARQMLSTVRGDLIKAYGVAPSRIKVVDGGYRTLRGVELWIVPRGVHAPVATPNAFPRSRRAGLR